MHVDFRSEEAAVSVTQTAKITTNQVSWENTVAVDWDGCIFERAFPNQGDLRPGARELLTLLKLQGWYIVINSTRTWEGLHTVEQIEQQVQHMTIVLDQLAIPYHEIHVGRGKVGARVYIDDHAIRPDSWWAIWPEIQRMGSFEDNRKYEQSFETSRQFAYDTLKNVETEHLRLERRKLETALRAAQSDLAAINQLLYERDPATWTEPPSAVDAPPKTGKKGSNES